MRLFIAAMLPEDTCRHVLNMQQALVETMASCKLTRPEHLHLTLRFIGEAGEERVNELTEWFETVGFTAHLGAPCHIKGYGGFFSRDGLTVFAALRVPDPLVQLQNTLEQGLRALCIQPETRPWVPHITLARKTKLRRALSDIPTKGHQFHIKQLALIKSQLTPEGPVYTPIITSPSG